MKIDKRFEIVKELRLTVPKNYNHYKQLEFFYENCCDEDRRDFLKKAISKLIPGKTHTVKIIGIKGNETSEDCLIFLKQNNSILVGAQGLSLVYQLKKQEFPNGTCLSFDEKDKLPWRKNVGDLDFIGTDLDGDFLVPYIKCSRSVVHKDPIFDFNHSSFRFSHSAYGDDHFLCFCK